MQLSQWLSYCKELNIFLIIESVNLSSVSFISISPSDDVYRRKKSEREYQQKIEDGLIVLTKPVAKWSTEPVATIMEVEHLRCDRDTNTGVCIAMDLRQTFLDGSKDCYWMKTCLFMYSLWYWAWMKHFSEPNVTMWYLSNKGYITQWRHRSVVLIILYCFYSDKWI